MYTTWFQIHAETFEEDMPVINQIAYLAQGCVEIQKHNQVVALLPPG